MVNINNKDECEEEEKHLGEEEAVNFLRCLREAVQGTAEAQCELGEMYEFGPVPYQDIEDAMKWYRKSAEQGFAEAQCKLGEMYDMDDPVEAAKWFRKAAEQGDHSAQIELGNLYYIGSGVIEDSVEAYKWFNLAAAQDRPQGDPLAPTGRKRRDAIAKEMTKEQISDAQKLSREWLAKHSEKNK